MVRRSMFLDGSPNPIAYLSFLLFGPIVWWAFSQTTPSRATAWTLVGGVAFLPEVLQFDPPVLPPFDKQTITSLVVFVVSAIRHPERYAASRPLRGYDLLFVTVSLGAVATVFTNPDPVVTGPIVRPGLAPYDAIAGTIKDALYIYFPFLVARTMFRSVGELRDFLEVLLKIAFIYSLVALFEIRFSPQTHRILYGYHAADFSMTMRFGGYRPSVFMISGLSVAMLLLSADFVAIVLVRTGVLLKRWLPWYLGVVLVLCKSTGALVYAAVLWPVLVYVKKPRFILPAAFALLVISFPILRGTDVFPTDELVEAAESINEERALSLWFRFFNEDQLLERARERMWFGWGGYDRNRVFHAETGEDLSITDGQWMIELGCRGAVGFGGLYLLLTWPILQTCRVGRRLKDMRVRQVVGVAALVASLNALELLPNGLFTFLPYVYSGVLAGIQPALRQLAGAPR